MCVSIRVCVCVQSVCVFVCNPCVCLARGAKSIVFYGVWGARGAPKWQKSEMLREPPSTKNRFSLRYVCFLAVFYWRKRQSVEVCVCLCAIRVCVCVGRRKIGKRMGAKVCNPCVCLQKNAHILLPMVVFAIKNGTKTHTYLERKRTHTWSDG